MASPVQLSIANTSIVAAQPAALTQLPKSIIAEGQWIVADMDGTLIGLPGYKKEPTLEQSVAKEAIFDWLRAGGHMLVLTGCETQRTIDRFARFIPDDLQSALLERRLLLGTNGGSVLCYYDGTRWQEDVHFLNTAIKGGISIAKEEAGKIVKQATCLLNAFYKELRDDPKYLEKRLPEAQAKTYSTTVKIAAEHPKDFTEDELMTLNPDRVPRIEVRKAENGNIVQISIIGIPVDLNYDVSKLISEESKGAIELSKVSLTHELNVHGVDKALAIHWLQEKGSQFNYPQFNKNKSLAVGDRPGHNDAPLTKVVNAFVSVCERDNPQYIPSHVTLKMGNNEAGTEKLLRGLLAKAKEFASNSDMKPVLLHAVDDVVKS